MPGWRIDQLGQGGSIRAAWYLVLFPTGFFLAMVYTEALFLALAFGSLTQIADRRPLVAGILAALATLTRPVGVALAIPLVFGAVAWWRASRAAAVEPDVVPRGAEASSAEAATAGTAAAERRFGPLPIVGFATWAAAIAFPLIAYLGWSMTMGADFDVLQREFFGRAALDLDGTLSAWSEIVDGLGTAEPRTVVYYALEFAAVVLAVVASLWALRRWPGPAIFGLVAILVPLTSGAPQSLIRYVLAVPAIFLLLASLGRSRVFDRGWSLVSTLLMGLLLTLFTFDFWVA